jgi:hypothetical protein
VVQDIKLSFAGEYGPLNLSISRLATAGTDLIGAILVVDRAPWPDTPNGPFIIELFNATLWRRHGGAPCAPHRQPWPHHRPSRLRVAKGNHLARRLYESCGFMVVAAVNTSSPLWIT